MLIVEGVFSAKATAHGLEADTLIHCFVSSLVIQNIRTLMSRIMYVFLNISDAIPSLFRYLMFLKASNLCPRITTKL